MAHWIKRKSVYMYIKNKHNHLYYIFSELMSQMIETFDIQGIALAHGSMSQCEPLIQFERAR